MHEQGAWLVFEDEAGQSLRPPKARTWAPRGRTPVVKVTGKGYGRVSLAGLICTRPGQRTRLMFRTLLRRGRAGEVKGFGPCQFAGLLDAAHAQLGGRIVLVWDNDRRHLSKAMRTYIQARSAWLTVFQLPAYAPELNPVEQVWSALKRGLANLAPRDTDQLAAVVKTKLKRMQYRHGLLDGFTAATGLTLDPP
ncbi:transposase [Nonomuraea lactucae]|uniref:transposase n=1 Tax=Nonomuraea lactucae TaxID=2249762 RepID=UPI000DE3BDC9|nr:transposase [Nonomuraea lactucae]